MEQTEQAEEVKKPKIYEDDTLDDLEPQAPAAPEYEDIDPSDWLADDDATASTVHYYNTSNGKRIRIAPITDAEEHRIQKASRRPDPTNPSRKIREFTIYKREFVAASINKAYGARIGDHNYVDPNALGKKMVGELTKIMTQIMNISGMDTGGGDSAGAAGFFA